MPESIPSSVLLRVRYLVGRLHDGAEFDRNEIINVLNEAEQAIFQTECGHRSAGKRARHAANATPAEGGGDAG